MQDKNIFTASGMIQSIEKSHNFHGEQFYRIMLEVSRLSETMDVIPVIISEKLLYNNAIHAGMYISVSGQIRTKNHKDDNDKNRLFVFGYAGEVEQMDGAIVKALQIKNEVEMEGYVCKTPTHRKTNTGRIITDLLVACNRQYSKSDYIPCIVWGINAKMAKNLHIGDKVRLFGRFQSREYRRKIDDTNQIRIAYEVSISRLEIIDDTLDAELASEENKNA